MTNMRSPTTRLVFCPHDTAGGPRMYMIRGCVTFSLICPMFCAEDTQFIGGSIEANLES